uniref:Uncharacterized protein n=1 Tax=Terrapene triunguis TaxID=2587831 RepID=A0A674JJY2_9SAUR
AIRALGETHSCIWTQPYTLTVFALLFDFLKRRKSWSRYPPGPTSLPFIGTMLQIDFHNPHRSFTQVSARGAGEHS